MDALLLSEQNNVTTRLVKDPTMGREVIKKILEVRNPTKKQIRDFQFEFNVLKSLDLKKIRRPLELIREQEKEVAFYEFFEGVTIKKIIQTGKANLPFVLKTGIFLADVLADIHDKGVIHKSINSHNILYNLESDDFCLIDFSHASTFREKKHLRGNPITIAGDIAYISPEQTGRMNRQVDSRSDLYSAGVVLYEMILGSVPFSDSDLLQVVHGHIAKKPDMGVIFNHFPKPIGKIIGKLLSKEAELRYQSGRGLKHDLEKCLREFELERSIMDFEIATKDFNTQLRISQKLYGRSDEIKLLNSAFKEILKGSSSAVMLSGYSGVGKSVLVHEVYQSISRADGYFVKGKYDQLQRNIPYYAIAQALKEYVTLLLTEPESTTRKIRENILQVLGAEAKLITDIVPTLESFIGKSPEIPPLGGQEAQNRFNYVFQKFIRGISTPKNPMVMFIDDLQWADLASIQLISNLLRDRTIRGFLFVGAYRDNEVSEVHALSTMLKDLETEQAKYDRIHLEGLSVEDVSQLLADSLSTEEKEVAQFGTLIHKLTGGNAFYVNQLLETLNADGHLTFSTKSNKWEWNEEVVAGLKVSENVISLLTARLKRLDNPTQKLLETASCIGNYFELDQIHTLLGSHDINVDQCLTLALEEELVRTDDAGYSFAHDRIQQAVYALIDPERQKNVHLEIGRTLLKRSNGSGENIFEIIDQINAGRELVKDEAEREYFARLNLRSGNNAKSSTAYDSALTYFNAALFFSNDWKTNYDFNLEVYSNAAEAAYLGGNYESVARYTQEVMTNADKLLDKIAVYRIQIESLKSQNKLPQAVEKGLEVLAALGIKMPYKPTKIRVLLQLLYVKLNLAGRNIEKLLELKKMSDPYKLASMQILVSIGPAIYWASPNLIPLTIFNMVLLSVRNGNANESTFAYSTYGLILCGVTGQINQGNRYGDLALQLSERVSGPNQVKGIFNVYCFVNHWEHHLRESFAPFLRSFQLGLENGDLEFGALSAYLYCNHNFYSGRNLGELDDEMAAYSEEIRLKRQNTPLNYLLVHWQTVKCLIGETKDQVDFNGPVYFEKEKVTKHLEAKDHTALFKYHLQNLILYSLYQDHENALKHMLEGEKYIDAVTGMFVTPVFHFYSGLSLAGSQKGSHPKNSAKIRQLRAKLRMFRKWARYCPENHEHRYYLLLAEYSNLKGNHDEAHKAYLSAMEIAGKNGFIQEQALACELTGLYYLARNETNLAYFFLTRAFQYYREWGAKRKCDQLNGIHNLDEKITEYFSQLTGLAQTSKSNSTLQRIDINTVIKASNAIAEDIEFENLKTILMKIITENVGAEKGVLLIHENGNLKVEKHWPEKEEISYSGAIVGLVEKTQEPIVCQNAVKDQAYSSDPHILKDEVKSVLCFPVVHQGEPFAIIYLENNLVQGAFSEERIEILKLLSGQIAVSLKNSILYSNLGKAYQNEVDLKQAYSQFVPLDFLKFLGKDSIMEVALGDQVQKEVTIMFIDIKDYTTISEKMSPKENFDFINACLHRVSPFIYANRGFICQFLGDGIMAIFKDDPQDGLKAAVLIQQDVLKFNEEIGDRGVRFSIGIGLHTGKVMLGIIGDDHRLDQNVISDTVNIASRVEALTRIYGASVMLTKQTLKRLSLEKDYSFRKLGRVLVKGKLKEIEIYECLDGLHSQQHQLKNDTKALFDDALEDYHAKDFPEAVKKFNQVKQLNPEDKAVNYLLERSEYLLVNGAPENWSGVDVMAK